MLKNAIPLEHAPLDACLSSDDKCVLAIIVGVEGPSYRPLGAMMAIFETLVSVAAQVSYCLHSCREDQHAKYGLRDCFHRSFDQQRMDNAPYNDHRREGRVSETPCTRTQAQTSTERGQKRGGEDRPHCD